ncbi:MAG: MaoC/PaaZ C-terminal domain-containing protein [Pseudomonadota bacterium]
MRKFDDLEIGETRLSDPLEVRGEDMLEFAKKYDPQWFHADEEAAKTSDFGELIASGIYTAALWRKLDHSINGDVDFICGVAWEDVRWPKAVKAGAKLRATSEVLEKRASETSDDRGIAVFRYGLVDQEGEEVFSCRSINLVRRSAG